jgi:DNA-binding transcriptional MocR family regulator
VYGDSHFGERLPSLKSLDTADLVIHQGSASKTVSPALRLGWLVASRAALDLLAPAKANLDLSTPALTQGVLADFMAGAGYARHQRQFRDAMRARRDTLIGALAEHCPELRVARPEGGLYLWAELPPALPALQFEAAAAAAGVAVRSGDAFMANGGSSRHIRLCFAAPASGEISDGAARLGKVLRSLMQARRVTSAAAACASV